MSSCGLPRWPFYKYAPADALDAAKVLKPALRRWLIRKWAAQRVYLADIYFEADHDIAEEVFIVGEFTQPKWLVKVPMKYSSFFRAFKAQVKIHDNCQFKFIIDGMFI